MPSGTHWPTKKVIFFRNRFNSLLYKELISFPKNGWFWGRINRFAGIYDKSRPVKEIFYPQLIHNIVQSP
jgi:hypothetical protein